MEIIKIEPTKHKAGILLDPKANIFQFWGFSLPEDAMDFFLPVINWLYDYVAICDEKAKSNEEIIINFKLSYYNTASHRAFLEIFRIFKKIAEKGVKMTINWYYETDDNSMHENGEELAELVELPVNFIEVKV